MTDVTLKLDDPQEYVRQLRAAHAGNVDALNLSYAGLLFLADEIAAQLPDSIPEVGESDG